MVAQQVSNLVSDLVSEQGRPQRGIITDRHHRPSPPTDAIGPLVAALVSMVSVEDAIATFRTEVRVRPQYVYALGNLTS
ncbi:MULTISPECIES: hypothetical protein [unclassified Streptomyces]|uniref:Transposase n=1 Tax=Streptomyces sp. NBC_00060 TaxID=2975636 RepID=A0AAU2GTK3_9ACTN